MARLPRLAVAGRAHLVVQRAHAGTAVFADEADRDAYLEALRAASAGRAIAIHAYALGQAEVQLLATPRDDTALSLFMQDAGRRYVSAYNRRHARRGTLWEGRYRAGVIEAGPPLLAALLLVDGQPVRTSAPHRTGGTRDPLLVDPPEFWTLGNTPFDREAAYGLRLAQGIDPATATALREAALGGWAYGSPSFIGELAALAARSVRPRASGRPARRG